MPHVNVNGIQIHYRESGEGFPIVLVHGFTGNARNWALTVPALAQRFRTVSPDMRGHGHSDKPTQPEDYSIELMAQDVYGVIQHLQIGTCYLIGHSMGGMIAQHVVLDHPDLVRALVLVDTAAEIPSSLVAGERYAQRERLVELAREQGMEAAFEEQLRLSPQREQLLANPQFLAVWRQQFLLTSREAYIYGARGMASRKSMLNGLHKIGVPTLVICGEDDEPFVQPSRDMHDRIPGSELAIIPGAGHTPQIERAAEFNQLLTRFLAGVHESAVARG